MRQLMHSFHGMTPPQDILDAVKRGEITSFCLFAGLSVANPTQLRDLCDRLYAAAREGNVPLPIIGMDQEGGQLMAVTEGVTELPGNMALGATRSPELAQKVGEVLGRELLAMGVNLNFAPSLDVNINPDNPVIGTRAFGDDPQLIAELGVALIRGLQNVGVLATAKHFPGHGDTAMDTHHGDAILPHPLARLEDVELVPFQAAIQAGVDVVMPAHLSIAAFDEENPATLSPAILKTLLREKMSFGGLIITDAMDMHAVAQFGPLPSLRRALEAGADIAMMGHLKDQLGLMRELAPEENPEAVRRIRAVQEKLPTTLPSLDVLDSAEHRAIAQEVAERSITLVKDGGQLPLRLAEGDVLAVITPRPVNLTPADTSASVEIKLADSLREKGFRVEDYQISMQASEAEIAVALEAVSGAKQVIIGTINAQQDPSQVALVNAMQSRGQRPIVVALRIPYDLTAFPNIETYLCTYSIRQVSMRALARVLVGEIEAQGILPCKLPIAAG
jgi:beta-N-acetylhexosaminidase